MKYKISGKPGDDVCLITSEDERTIIGQNGKIIITDYATCEKIIESLKAEAIA